jgi:hypothetical protein
MSNLLTEFTRGNHHQADWSIPWKHLKLPGDVFNHWQDISQFPAASCFGDFNNITTEEC